MPFIYSTLSVPHKYVVYKNSANGTPRVDKYVLIKGGANIADNHTLITPRGVATQVTDEEMTILNQCPVFLQHQKNGFITVDVSNTEKKIDKVVEEMEGRDKSSPLTPADFVDKELPAPILNKKKQGR